MAARNDPRPVDERVAALVDRMSEADAELFCEAAAIREYSAGMERNVAEVEALLDVLARGQRTAQPTVRAFRLVLPDGGSQWALAEDVATPLAYLRELGGSDITEEPLDDVLHAQFDGFAFLATPD